MQTSPNPWLVPAKQPEPPEPPENDEPFRHTAQPDLPEFWPSPKAGLKAR